MSKPPMQQPQQSKPPTTKTPFAASAAAATTPLTFAFGLPPPQQQQHKLGGAAGGVNPHQKQQEQQRQQKPVGLGGAAAAASSAQQQQRQMEVAVATHLVKKHEKKPEHRSFKSTSVDGRFRRQEVTVELRKKKRDVAVSKKRRQMSVDDPTSSRASSLATATATASASAASAAGDEDGEEDGEAEDDDVKRDAWVPSVKLVPSAQHLVNVVRCKELGAVVAKTVASQPTLRTMRQQHLLEMAEVGQAFNSDDRKLQVMAATKFRKAMSCKVQPPIQEAIDAGFVVRALFLASQAAALAAQDPLARQLQHECLWACTNVASGNTYQTRHLVECGGIAVFLQSLSSTSEEIWSQGVWAIGNIAGDSGALRDALLSSGALPPILAGCSKVTKPETIRNVAWTLSNLNRGKPRPNWDLVKVALPYLAKMVDMKDSEIVTDACWSIAHLSDDNSKNPENLKIEAVVQTGVVPKLVEIMKTGTGTMRAPALRAIGHIASGTDQHTLAVIRAGALPVLHTLLQDPKQNIRKEACWTVSNVTTCNSDQIQSVIDAMLIPPLIMFAKSSSSVDFDTRREATYAVANATVNATPAQIRYLVKHGLIAALCSQLATPDPALLLVVMDAVRNILTKGEKPLGPAANTNGSTVDAHYRDLLEESDGQKLFEALTSHDNEDIYDNATKFLNDFFPDKDDEDQDALSVVTREAAANLSSFAFGDHPATSSTPAAPAAVAAPSIYQAAFNVGVGTASAKDAKSSLFGFVGSTSSATPANLPNQNASAFLSSSSATSAQAATSKPATVFSSSFSMPWDK